MTTRTLITHALWAMTLSLPAALSVAQPTPAPRPAPRPAPVPAGQEARETPRQGPELQPLTIGEMIVGALNRNDYTTASGQTWDVYQVQLTAGEIYHFTVGGQGYNAWVDVRDANGEPLEGIKTSTSDHSFTIYTVETAVYSILVGTRDQGSSGRYILNSGTGEPPAPIDTITPPADTRAIHVELNDQSSSSEQGRYFAYSLVELEAGKTYCLYLESPDDGVFANCERIEGHPVEFHAIEMEGAYIRFSPTVSGQHALLQLAKEPNHATSFTGYAWMHNTGSRISILDQLSADSTLLDDGTYFGFHEVELVAGTTYVIDVTSDEFDTLAYLFDADNNQLATNDDGEGTGTHAQITFTPETSGTYSVGVGTKHANATGWYLVGVASGDMIGAEPAATVTRGDDEAAADETMDQLDAGPRNGDTHAIVGYWEATSVELNGQTTEMQAGMLYVIYNADGTAQIIQSGSEISSGQYRIEGDQLIETDADGNNEETASIQIDGDTLVMTGEFEPGVEMTITFRRTNRDGMTAGLANLPSVVGRWDMTRIAADGEVEQIPAGSLVITLYPNGTIRAQGEGITDTGVYTIEGNQITITYASNKTPATSTFTIRDGIMTIENEYEPGKIATMTLEYLGEPQAD